LFSHGRLLVRLDKYREAEEVLKKAENIWKVTDDFVQLGRTYIFLGQINRLLGRQPQALESYTKARKYFELAQDRVGVSDSLQGLATVSLRAGDTQEAIRFLDQAKQQCDGHEPSIASISFYTAWVLRHENPSYSASLALDAHEAFAKYGARYRAALCTYQMGIAQYSSGNYDEADGSLLRAYREFDELDNYGQMGYALDHLVELEVQRGNLEQAPQYSGEALSVFERIENHAEIVACYISRGRVLAQMGRTSDAQEAYSKARAVAEHWCNIPELLQTIDKEVQILGRKSGWRKLLPW
jgi:tetratricopeptide (TPR) repeat protein